MTETITHIAIKKLNHKDETENNQDVYKALPGVSFALDDRNCLIITASAISKNKVVTNDVVQLFSKTSFQWLGRADFVINSAGHKVHPEQVEQVLALVIDAPFFISSLPDPSLGDKVILVIEGNEDTFPEIDYVRLHPYEKPKEIYFVKELIYTTTGKINREETKNKLFSKK
jgi:O-succinylbenzoic acid--CoA ligase